ncbi:hypothetical protein RND71_000626 [Anisodus tanguticus]|uniref:Uncharacterized protein n=1 Tax=Anisodus tanguticus TaxID=243964 RepID=A0AAE1SXP6_9SOLA|nr:hypothetical protein RND71_000626 [Anisodus tanguticus]
MAPNRWDSLTKTLERPLRLSKNINDDDHEQSLLVRISQPSDSPHSFSVFSGQVRRLVRLSVEENKRLSGYLWRSKGEGIWECV